jgi:malonyl-CoA decarboxylase
MSNIAFLQELLNSIAERGRSLLPRGIFRDDEPVAGLQALVEALMSGRGEASGVALAQQLLRHYRILDPELRLVFFQYIAQRLRPDPEVAQEAARAYLNAPTDRRLAVLQKAIESPRQEFFRRLNLAPGATAEIVGMRADLLGWLNAHPELAPIDDDIKHLLGSWFNRGFLVLRRIDWQTPASILEKIIAYEAVHEISGWDELRRRLDPRDRRCFAFFHPSMIDEPLIFVEVALVNAMSDNIRSVLAHADGPKREALAEPTTAVFYSISNCQKGLRGISFGNFLIKQVVEELSRECPSLRTFVTLSPVPGFARWLREEQARETSDVLNDEDRAALALLGDNDWYDDTKTVEALKPSLLALVAHYFLVERTSRGQPIDPVARFHLGNGARLERINWLADLSPRGLQQSFGVMVNYLYEIKDIERNHEAFANERMVVSSRQVRGLLRGRPRQRAAAGTEDKKPGAEVAPEPARLPPPEKDATDVGPASPDRESVAENSD